jgi:hypothetical protein
MKCEVKIDQLEVLAGSLAVEKDIIRACERLSRYIIANSLVKLVRCAISQVDR